MSNQSKGALVSLSFLILGIAGAVTVGVASKDRDMTWQEGLFITPAVLGSIGLLFTAPAWAVGVDTQRNRKERVRQVIESWNQTSDSLLQEAAAEINMTEAEFQYWKHEVLGKDA